MFELLLDPTVAVAAGTFGTGFVLARIERKFKRTGPTSTRPAQATPKDPYARDSSDPYQCAVWEIRWFESRLVEENSLEIKDMTVCDDSACANCIYTRKKKQAHLDRKISEQKQEEKDRALRAAKERRVAKDRELRERLAAAQADRKKRDLDATKWHMQHRRNFEGRVMVDGKMVTRPVGVPDYANGKMMYDANLITDVVMWSWIDRATGFPMAVKSIYTDDVALNGQFTKISSKYGPL